MSRKLTYGFSLLELLVVIAIIALLLALVTPAMNSTLSGGRMTQAATLFVNQCSIGHLKAIGENRPIRLRLIRKDADSAYDRMQLVANNSAGTLLPVEKVNVMPTGTALARSVNLSSLLDASKDPSLAEKAAGVSDPAIPEFGTTYRYVEFSFRPRGSLDLDITKKWFVTVVMLRDENATQAPANFATVQIDPVNGGIQVFRP
jgi:uncharacterized protein (TIGR02596 family)